MHRRLDRKTAELLGKGAAALGIVAGVVALFGIDGPVKWGVVIVGLAAAYFSWRSTLPTAQDLIICALLTTSVVFGVALYEGRDDDHVYDFVITPRDGAVVTTESAYPGPRHEVPSAGAFSYGEHVRVDCVVEGEDGKPWYELPDSNYLKASDLSPSLHSGGTPPPCAY